MHKENSVLSLSGKKQTHKSTGDRAALLLHRSHRVVECGEAVGKRASLDWVFPGLDREPTVQSSETERSFAKVLGHGN